MSCYEKDEEGLKLKKDFKKEEIVKLKALKKAINGNRKFAVNILPLMLVAVLIGGLVFFFTVMANPLLQRGMEAGLEAVFEARVNAEGFRISVLDFEISMDGLTIADRDSPMQNLIQFSTLRIKLLPQALLRGKVYIEEIRADSIRFGTARTVSGALPDKPPKVSEPRDPINIPPLIDLENFDAMAILNQQFERLQTPLLYNSAIDTYETTLAAWREEEARARARVAELQARAEPFMNINVNDYMVLDISTIELINNTINDINALFSTVQAAQNDITGIISSAQSDINTVIGLEQDARNAFSADFNYLRSFIDLESGAAMELLTVVVMSILTDTAGEYLAYGTRALELLEQLMELQSRLPASSPSPSSTERFQGRNVVFPTLEYPQFFLGIMAADILTPADWHWAFDLRSISSNPYYSGQPSSLSLNLLETGDGLQRAASFMGQADFRSNAAERFNLDFGGSGFPLDINLGDIGIGDLAGRTSFNMNLAGRPGGSFNVLGDITLNQASLGNAANTFAQAASDAINQMSIIDFGISYEHRTDASDIFNLNTNMWDIFRNDLDRIVSQFRRQAEEELERALRERIEQFLENTPFNMDELETVVSAIRDIDGTVNSIRGSLDQKRAELETRARSAAEDAARRAADEAMQQVQQAAQDALQNIAPNIPIPNVPGIPVPSIPNPFGR